LEAASSPTRADDKDEKEVIDKLRSLRTDPNPREEWVSLSVEKEVLFGPRDCRLLISINKLFHDQFVQILADHAGCWDFIGLPTMGNIWVVQTNS
jgi:hypothetical protein